MVKDSSKKLNQLKKRRLRSIFINITSIIVVVFCIAWIAKFFWRYTEYEITNNAIVDQYITPINIRVAGYIKAVNFTEHQHVEKGDTLIVLDDEEYRIKLQDAEAALLDAIGSKDVLVSTIQTSKSNVEVSEAAIEEARVRVWKTFEDEKRYANLLLERSVSLQEYQQIKAEYDEAVARYELLVKQKSYAKNQSQETTKKADNSTATIKRRQADVEMCRLNLKYTVVLAPYSGYVGRRTLGVGQLVQGGQILTNIISDSAKWVTANYKETQISKIFIGQQVNIKIDAYGDRVFKGTISAISEATGSRYSLIPTDNSAGNFVKVQQRIPVRIDFIDLTPQDNKLLRAGMMAVAEAKLK